MFSDDDRANGYNLGWGSSRIEPSDLLKVQKTGIWDTPSHVGRRIYFLEGQKNEALNLIRDNLEETITTMVKNVNGLGKQWEERNRQ